MKPRSFNVKSSAKAPAEQVVKDIQWQLRSDGWGEAIVIYLNDHSIFTRNGGG